MDDIISPFDRPLTIIFVFNIVYFTLNILGVATLFDRDVMMMNQQTNSVPTMKSKQLMSFLLDQPDYHGSGGSSSVGGGSMFRSTSPTTTAATTATAAATATATAAKTLTQQTEILLSYGSFRCPLTHAGRFIQDSCRRLVLESEVWRRCEGRKKKGGGEDVCEMVNEAKTCRAVGSKTLLSVTVRVDGSYHCVFEDVSGRFGGLGLSTTKRTKIMVRTRRLVLVRKF